MDLLAAIAADPTLLPLWAVMLFAAGMYPIGMIFGCSSCCDRQCNHCTGTLPETLTVAIDGIPESHPGDPLITLSFSGCGGSGGSGIATAPGQSALDSDPIDDRGPITAVSLTDGGSGYAKLGRAAPTLSASVYTSTGSGASLDVTVTKAGPDECGLHYWEVSKVTVLDGGTGYDPWDGVWISPSEGDSADSGAVASITLAQLPPDLTLAVESQAGSGAELTPGVFETWWSTPQARAWSIYFVTVDDGGDGYTHLDTVKITRGPGTINPDGWGGDASLALVTANTEPTVSASVQSAGGTGAALTVTLAETVIYPPPAYSAVPAWAVQSIAVDSPGTGYAYLDLVFVSVVDGDTRSTPAGAIVTAVDANGGIVEVYVFDGGEYFKGGPITAVSVADGGAYVKRNGQIESVAIIDGGRYYREDASLPPYVASVTVNINQTWPSDGEGAVITATVGDDPQDPENFGKITGLTLENGGAGYLGYLLSRNCLARFNGRSVVVKQRTNLPCKYVWECAHESCELEVETVSVELPFSFMIPDGAPIRVSLTLQEWTNHNPFNPMPSVLWLSTSGTFEAQEMSPDCASIDVTAYGTINIPPEATAYVTAGGTYEEPEACKRFTLDDVDAIYGEIQWSGLTWDDMRRSSEGFGGSPPTCGSRSWFSIIENTPGTWTKSVNVEGCDQWKAQSPNNKFCSEIRWPTHFAARLASGVDFWIPSLGSTCRWKWTHAENGPYLCVKIRRELEISAGLTYRPHRECEWCYRIREITTDEETLQPTGVVFEEGAWIDGDGNEQTSPIYTTFGSGLAFVGPQPLLDEAVVCQNPGPPTVTFSPLP